MCTQECLCFLQMDASVCPFNISTWAWFVALIHFRSRPGRSWKIDGTLESGQWNQYCYILGLHFRFKVLKMISTFQRILSH